MCFAANIHHCHSPLVQIVLADLGDLETATAYNMGDDAPCKSTVPISYIFRSFST